MKTKPLHILLIEDNEDDVIMTQESFDENNLVNIVGVVQDGEEAMAYLRREGKYQSVELPDLILLDLNMPKKNGFEVLAEMKADPALRHIPVVILTTSDREEDIVKSYANGACSFIPKPVGFDNCLKVSKQFSLYWTLVARTPKRQIGKKHVLTPRSSGHAPEESHLKNGPHPGPKISEGGASRFFC